MKDQIQREEKAFEEFCREVAHSARADEEVINAAADSPFLFQRVRAQLAAEPEPLAKRGWLASLFGGARFPGWAMAATAMALLIATMMLARAARQTMPEPPAPMVAGTPVGRPSMPVGITTVPTLDGPKVMATAANETGRNHFPRRSSVQRVEEEVTTEYMPLTYVAYADEADGGHVVRVQVPRSALLTLGVPLGAAPSAELVKADVIVGDDGLARAIRLVR
ncbi:MAG: hypothetical protein ABI977_33915 [Acidobacteriota bacterium]